jgi:AraC-like DNA-binding protein
LLQGDGLATVLDTNDFGCWEAAVISTLGHHRSALLGAREAFQARFRTGRIGGYRVLHLQGRGRLRLSREQREDSVLWLPLRGMTRERVNGEPRLAEPGTGLLFHPGDVLEGETSDELEGISILIPPELHGRPGRAGSPLLAAGPLQREVVASARTLAAAAAEHPPGAEHAADRFTEALRSWRAWREQPDRRERITAFRRRTSVEQARDWLAPRLRERFSVEELSQAVGLSPRQLQYNFLQELGHSPMAEAKRLRLQRLRSLLLDPALDHRGVAELMEEAGLLASGVTAADYRRWCGESPRHTRQHRSLFDQSTTLRDPTRCHAATFG